MISMSGLFFPNFTAIFHVIPSEAGHRTLSCKQDIFVRFWQGTYLVNVSEGMSFLNMFSMSSDTIHVMRVLDNNFVCVSGFSIHPSLVITIIVFVFFYFEICLLLYLRHNVAMY